jgi:hypothetical protein
LLEGLSHSLAHLLLYDVELGLGVARGVLLQSKGGDGLIVLLVSVLGDFGVNGGFLL